MLAQEFDGSTIMTKPNNDNELWIKESMKPKIIGKAYPQKFIKQKSPKQQWDTETTCKATRKWDSYEDNREEVLGIWKKRIVTVRGNPESVTDVFTGPKENEQASAKSTHGHLTDKEAERGCEIIYEWISGWEKEGRLERVSPLPEFTQKMTYRFTKYETTVIQEHGHNKEKKRTKNHTSLKR